MGIGTNKCNIRIGFEIIELALKTFRHRHVILVNAGNVGRASHLNAAIGSGGNASVFLSDCADAIITLGVDLLPCSVARTIFDNYEVEIPECLAQNGLYAFLNPTFTTVGIHDN